MKIGQVELAINRKIENGLDRVFDTIITEIIAAEVDGSLKMGLHETILEDTMVKLMRRYYHFIKLPTDAEKKEHIYSMLDAVKLAFETEEVGRK